MQSTPTLDLPDDPTTQELPRNSLDVDPRSSASDVRRVLGLQVPVGVTLADRAMSIQSILAMTVGTIIEFDVPFDAELMLCVAGRQIGKGRAVKVGEHFGLRITRIETVRERMDAITGE